MNFLNKCSLTLFNCLKLRCLVSLSCEFRAGNIPLYTHNYAENDFVEIAIKRWYLFSEDWFMQKK